MFGFRCRVRPPGEAFRDARADLCRPASRAREFAPRKAFSILTSLGMQSGCWVPLVHRGQAIGALAVASRMEGAFGKREAEMLTQIADQVAMAVNNAMAFRQIAELRDRLSQEKQYLEEEINLENRFEDIVGESGGLRQVSQARLKPSRPPMQPCSSRAKQAPEKNCWPAPSIA